MGEDFAQDTELASSWEVWKVGGTWGDNGKPSVSGHTLRPSAGMFQRWTFVKGHGI